MSAQPQNTYYTVEEYLKLDRESTDARYEYDDGYVRMMVGGTRRHQIICVNTSTILNLALRSSPCEVLSSDMRVQINSARYVYPDLTVACDSADQGEDTAYSPVVIFEVLSPGTESLDRGRKADDYRALLSLQEYVLIDQTRPYVQVQRRYNDSSLWTIENYGEDDSFTLNSIGVTVPLADIYRKVVFPDTPQPEL